MYLKEHFLTTLYSSDAELVAHSEFVRGKGDDVHEIFHKVFVDQ